MSKTFLLAFKSATRDLNPNSDKLPLFSVHQDLDGIKFKEMCGRSLYLLLVMVFLLGSLVFQEETQSPVLVCMYVLTKTALSKYILVKQIKRDPCLSHLIPFFLSADGI